MYVLVLIIVFVLYSRLLKLPCLFTCAGLSMFFSSASAAGASIRWLGLTWPWSGRVTYASGLCSGCVAGGTVAGCVGPVVPAPATWINSSVGNSDHGPGGWTCSPFVGRRCW